MTQSPSSVPQLVQDDGYLAPHTDAIRGRLERLAELTQRLPADVSRGHEHFGFTRGVGPDGQPGLWYREWAPQAEHLALVGDFNQWDGQADPLTRGDYGQWEAFFPDATYGERLVHASAV